MLCCMYYVEYDLYCFSSFCSALPLLSGLGFVLVLSLTLRIAGIEEPSAARDTDFFQRELQTGSESRWRKCRNRYVLIARCWWVSYELQVVVYPLVLNDIRSFFLCSMQPTAIMAHTTNSPLCCCRWANWRGCQGVAPQSKTKQSHPRSRFTIVCLCLNLGTVC